MRQPSPSSLLFFCFCLVVSQFFSPVFVQAQGARVRQANASADKERNRADTEERDSDADNPQGRQEWFRGGRHEAGEHAADLLRRAYGQKRQMRAVSPGSGQSAMTLSNTSPGATTANGIPFNGQTFLGTWSNLGPAPIGSDPGQDYGKVVGRVTSVVVDQGDGTGNTVYIGAAFGGVWKSSNAAASDPTTVTWTPLIDDQPTLAVGAVTVQPTNSNVVLVGTGESNSSGDSYYGMGILRSTDAGKTWNLVKSADNGVKAFAGLGTSSFAWSTDTPNLVVLGMASTNGRRYGSDSVGGRGIYYSQDAGATWHYATVQDPGGATLSEGTVTALAFSPATHKFYAFYRYHGFYESADAVNWTRSAFQPSSTGALNVTNCPSNQPAPNPTGNCPLYRGQIAVQPSTHDMYVIYVNDSDTHQGVFVTSNGATTAWRELNSKGSAGLVDTASTNTIEQGDYNLWLGAVPSVQGTDLLVGTRNIYKCSLAAGGDCATWLDLTHVYTCNPIASPSHVHPDQHGFDFSVAHPTVMYFANDGGVYRTLNGTAVSTGACTSPNPFDNLDANMGSLSEMVSFSQHPTNRNVLLGGLQDNGSTALLGSGAPFWQTVNGGDGGFNEIDPNNPDGIWYATNTGVSIQQCNATNKQPPPNGPGIPNAESCNPGTFGAAPYPAAGPNIGPSHVANDSAEFYMPYIFDPANTSNLIVGTCRLWRGPGVGGSTWLDASSVANKDISPAFDNTASLPCAAGSTKVRAIAAGGPAPNGISQVIYVGLEGAGTFNASGGNLAHVFVNTRADVNTGTHGAANGWTDVTANIAATLNGSYGQYPVSSVEIDRNDASGRTAYVTIEGFGVSHVLKTSTAGQTWNDMTNNLPDAPVDSIAVDPDDPNVLYAGSDIGSFVSFDGGASWQILGTNLPDVPVTKIRVFASANTKLLRVSTYGRGVWELAMPAAPSFTISANSGISSATVNAGQAATYTLDVIGINGFSGSVSLACASGLPIAAACTFSPSTVTVSGTTVSSTSLAISTLTRTSSQQPASVAGSITFPKNHGGPGGILAIALGTLGTLALLTNVNAFKRRRVFALSSIAGMLMLVPGCGGGAGTTTTSSSIVSSGTPAGTYTVTVTATSGNRVIPTAVTLKVN